MEKVRFAEQYPNIFSADEKASKIVVPARSYLSIKGKGGLKDNSQYQEAKHLLQGVAFLIKYSFKQHPPLGFFDYYLPPYEIIWHAPEKPTKEQSWTLLLMQPNYVDKDAVEQAVQQIKNTHNLQQIKTPPIVLATYPEKTCVHIHHTGKYTAQKRSINALDSLAKKEGLALTTKQHEVFLKDPLLSALGQSNIIIRYATKKAR